MSRSDSIDEDFDEDWDEDWDEDDPYSPSLDVRIVPLALDAVSKEPLALTSTGNHAGAAREQSKTFNRDQGTH